MNLLYKSVFFFCLSLCFSFGQNIDQTWQLDSISSNHSNHITLNDSIVVSDFQKLKLRNGTFQFSNDKNNNELSGNYIYQNQILFLFFDEPKDIIHKFRVKEINDSNLILSANQKEITYSNLSSTSKKQKTKSSTVALTDRSNFENQGITLNSLFRGILGISFLLGFCFLLSGNRRAIDWKLVVSGLLLQLVFALLVLKVDIVATIFDWVSTKIVKFLELSDEGARFVFGELISDMNPLGYIFAFKVLPTIVFFSAFTSVLYYLGILQKIVWLFAYILNKTMHLSGAESLSAAANIFIGQTEAPLLIKPYLDKMTKSEILAVMIGGMATIAGGVLAAFIGFLGGESMADQIAFTKHLLTASVMSAPAALLISKMLLPQTEHQKVNTNLNIAKDKIGSNILDAISNGTTDGVKLAVNVGAMLLVFTALIAVFNGLLSLIGDIGGLNQTISEQTNKQYNGLSLQLIFGYVFAPIAWMIGVATEDIVLVGQLLGEKTIINEFIAYGSLRDMKNSGQITNSKSIIIATYALCGFANFASIGIQIGGIGVLAPKQRRTLAKFGIKALIGGTVAALLTATIAGMIIN